MPLYQRKTLLKMRGERRKVAELANDAYRLHMRLRAHAERLEQLQLDANALRESLAGPKGLPKLPDTTGSPGDWPPCPRCHSPVALLSREQGQRVLVCSSETCSWPARETQAETMAEVAHYLGLEAGTCGQGGQNGH